MEDTREVIQKQSWLSWGIKKKLFWLHLHKVISLLILFATDFSDKPLINYYET